MIEMLIAGLAFGLLMGLLIGRNFNKSEIDDLEEINQLNEERLKVKDNLIREQHELILLQKAYIEQENIVPSLPVVEKKAFGKERRIDRAGMIAERAKRLEKHCHMCHRLEMMTSNGLLVVKIFNDHGKAVRVTYKDGEPVDIQKAPDDMLRPIKTNSNEITFGGF